MATQIFANNAATTLRSSISSGDLFIDVIDTSTFPTVASGEYFLVTIEQAGVTQIIRLTNPGKSGANTLIVDPAGRGWEGTTPGNFTVGARVEGRLTAGTLDTIYSTAATDLATEVGNRGASEANLQAQIDAEAVTRATDVGSEAASRAAADALLAPLVSPVFTGNPTYNASISLGDNSKTLANTEFVAAIIATLDVATIASDLATETGNRISGDAARALLAGSASQVFSVANSTASTNQAVPRAQADSLYAPGNSSFFDPGYAILAGGLVIQWGTIAGQWAHGQFVSFTFPITFPHTCFVITGGMGPTQYGTTTLVSYYNLSTLSQGGCTIQIGHNNGGNYNDYFKYIAIGY